MRSEEKIEKDWVEVCASGRRKMYVSRGRRKFGDIVDETYVVEDAGRVGDYVKLLQRIKRMNGDPWIRFTYYVKRPGWNLGSWPDKPP